MWTREYKGFYVHGFCDKNWTTVCFGSGGQVLPGHKFRSYRAAQLFITKILGLTK